MVDEDDWRIAHGQGEWSRGLVVRWSRWLPTPTIKITPTGDVEPSVWNHDHCEFCWQEFCDSEHDLGDGTQSLTEGYAARGPRGLPPEQQRDDYHWICPTCFNDLKDYFGWTLKS